MPSSPVSAGNQRGCRLCSCAPSVPPPQRLPPICLQVIPQRICTRQQRTAFQCLMNDMRILAEARQIESVEEVEIDGIDYSVVPQAVDDSHVNLLALHLPPQSRSLPKDLIALLGAVSAGVLVMKGPGFKVEGR